MKQSIKFALVAAVLAPCLALAAPQQTRKRVRTTTTTTTTSGSTTPADQTDERPQTIGGTLGGGSSFGNVLHNHLSLSAGFDFADSYEISGQKADSEKALSLGAQYAFDQFAQGLNLQLGGTYDFTREIKNANGLKVQDWTTYAELAAHVTPQFQVMGGLNYNFPNLSNAGDNVSIKGRIGYQVGASFKINEQIAIDGRYRALEMDISAPNGAGGTRSMTAKISGLTLGGRFLF